MSDYVRQKVLRIPVDQTDLVDIVRGKDVKAFEDFGLWAVSGVFPDLFGWGAGKFQISPAGTKYVDYVIEEEEPACPGEWGRTRSLTANERAKYLPIFHKIDTSICMNNVRLCEYTYYDGCTAPDYYDDANDPFYEEI